MTPCPSPDRLAALLTDGPADQDRELLERHLDDCASCRQKLLDLTDDTATWGRWEPLLRLPCDAGPPPEFLEQLKTVAFRHVAITTAGPAEFPRVPGYEILGELGQGGMAVVYKARQIRLNRLVALKMIQAGLHASGDVRTRFRAEAEAVARLQHPHIVRVYETGEHNGLPYISFEFVDGGNLAQYAHGTPQPPAAAAALVETLAWAMDYAHQKGIVHRDLKPANILLSSAECGVRNAESGPGDSGSGLHSTFRIPHSALQPKITDFGIAYLLDADVVRTNTGEILGTPGYMAPEQAQGRRSDVGPATDIHALGILLYELLTGRLPFAAATAVETLVQISFEEPPLPRRLRPGVPRDLETICLKCLRKLPHQRYRTARELAEDLGRFLHGEPVRARPVTTAERFVKWARRRPGIAGLIGGIIGIAVAAFVVVSLALVQARAARSDEARQRQDAETARAAAMEALDRSERSVYFGNIAQARSQWLLDNVAGAAKLLGRCPPDRRGWEWSYLHGLNHADLLTVADTGGPYLTGVAYGPTGDWLAVGGGNPFDAGQEGVVQVYDAGSGRLRWRRAGLPVLVWGVAVSPDGRLVASAGGPWRLEPRGELKLWDAATGELRHEFAGHADAAALSVAFSPDGRRLATACADKTVRVWDVAAGTEVYRYSHEHAAPGVAFTPDGRFLVSCGPDGIHFREAADGKAVRRLAQSGSAAAVSPDGRLIASTQGQQVHLWDVTRLGADADPPLVQTVSSPEGSVLGVAFAPDGRSLATTATDGAVRVWDVGGGQQQAVYRGHTGRVAGVAFHPDGRRLASAGQQPGDLKVWDRTRPADYVEAVSFGRDLRDVDAVAFTADDRELLVLGKGGRLRRWDCSTGLIVREQELDCSYEWLVPATPAAFSGDGRRLAAVRADDPTRVKVVDMASGREVCTLRGHTGRVWHIACDTTGTRIVTAAVSGRDGHPVRELKVWDAASGRVLREETTVGERPRCVALSPDGQRLAEVRVSSEPGAVGVFLSEATGSGTDTPIRLPGPEGIVSALAFSADGSRLAAATDGGRVHVWDREGRPIHPAPLQGPGGLAALAFSPDGSRLAGASRERVQVWDVASGQDIIFLRGAGARPGDNGFNPQIVWSHDGTRLAGSNWNRVVSVWDAADLTTAAGKAVLARQADSRALDWHLDHANLYAGVGAALAADFHRRRLEALDLPTPALRRQRADFHARRMQWDAAAADYAALFAGDLPGQVQDLHECAALLVRKGDLAGYRALLTRALRECGETDDAPTLRHLTRAGGLAPLELAEATAYLAVVRRCVAANTRDVSAADHLGLAHYRTGEWDEAVRCAHRSLDTQRGAPPVLAWLTLGLVHLRRSEPESAKPWLEKVDAWLATESRQHTDGSTAPIHWTWPGYLTVWVLRQEAAARLPTEARILRIGSDWRRP